MEPKLPKIKPNIQPNKIVKGSKGVYGGAKSKGVNPLVRNITDSDNLFSKLQERNPEVRNKRGTRTLFNMLGTFGTERNEKIIRRNLQLLRNTLVETFEIAKLLRMNAANSVGSKSKNYSGVLVGAAIVGGAGLGLGMGAGKLLSDKKENVEEKEVDVKKIEEELSNTVVNGLDEDIEADNSKLEVEEYDDDKLNSDLDNSSKGLIQTITDSFSNLMKALKIGTNLEGETKQEENKPVEKSDNTLKIEKTDSSNQNQNGEDLINGIENSFKDQLKGKIAEGESNTDYGAMYSRDREGFERGDEDITKMTISDVDKLQTDYLNYQTSIGRGDDRSAAMGAYQMLNPKKVAEMMDLDPETTVFDKKTQDMMSEYYLNYSGLKEFEAGDITAEEFNNRLAEQFASIKTTSGEGVYDTDKMNKANTSVLDLIKSQESKYKDQDLSTLLKSESKGEIIVIDNTKDLQMISGGKGKKVAMVNNDSGRGSASGPTQRFYSSFNPDASNISTKSLLGVV